MSNTSDLAAWAARYAAAGWPVYPVTPDTPGCGEPGSCLCKAPLTPNGFLDATTDPLQIDRWWSRWRRANIGIATGAPGPDVLDVDVADGKPGLQSLRAARDSGLIPPPMAQVRSGSGGTHLYYPGTDQRGGSLVREGLDWRAAGGGIIAPPSRVHGRPYTWVPAIRTAAPPQRIDFAKVRAYFRPPVTPRDWQPRELSDGSRDLHHLVDYILRLPEGHGRGANGKLYWAFCRAYDNNADQAVIDAIADAALQRGLQARAVEATRRSAESTPRQPTRPGPGPPRARPIRPAPRRPSPSRLDAGR